MKAISITEVGGETEIEVETGRWIFKRVTTYRTAERRVGDFFRFHSWEKTPKTHLWCCLFGLAIISDEMLLQLDSWKKSGI